MSMSVTYTTFNGLICHEQRSSIETEFIPDTKGSVIGVRNAADQVLYTASYWPFGEVASSTGVNSSPWQFVGCYGYYTDSAGASYVRARYYRPQLGRWQTVDPLWPQEQAYTYTRPVDWIDPSGTAIVPILCIGACIGAGGCAYGIYIACKGWRGAYDSFEECAMEFLKELPIHSLVGCGAALAGCIACLLKYAKPLCRRLFDGYCTPAEWAAWDKIIHNPNSCDGPRSCRGIQPPKTAAKCQEIDDRIQNGINCVAARLGRMIACIKSDRKKKEHQEQIVNATKTLWECQAKRIALGCP